ncbi:protein L-Myc-like [Oncorhynchus mykiss]|uniref:protein L-Myc-like n=1 Tax=Oncorhynchus mykiss TaxID=8022 RepID=UPI001878AE9A|nr:protein L-Myc-like [Oncorhynchus mykiss]
MRGSRGSCSLSQGSDCSDLFCHTCNQYFSSLHNKKEHLLGKQHLQALTEEFEKDTGSQQQAPEMERGPVEEEEEEEDDEEEAELARTWGLSSLDLSVLQELLLRHMKRKSY